LSELIHPFENTMKVDAAKMGSRILCDLLDGAGAVAVTVSGVVGDPGLPHLAPILTAQEPTRTRLAPFWHATGIRTNFHAILGVNRPILSIHGPLATTTATGLDNRSPLPPFVPFGTGEDTLFGSMLVKCLRGAYVGYLPFGLLHVHRHRAYSPPPSRPRVADLIGLIAADAPDVLSSGAESRMKAIGQHIVSCGTAPLGEFSEYVVQRSRRFLLNLIERCQALLDQYGGDPPDWAENLADWIARLEQVMLSPDVGIPANLPHAETTVERSVHLQQIVRDFGALLCSWSEVWKAARCLKDSGVALARRVE
jgi:hypothetical protein